MILSIVAHIQLINYTINGLQVYVDQSSPSGFEKL